MPSNPSDSLIYAKTHLAIMEVKKVAIVEVSVYEGMDYETCGRYLCFCGVWKHHKRPLSLKMGKRWHVFLLGERRIVLLKEDEKFPSKIEIQSLLLS